MGYSSMGSYGGGGLSSLGSAIGGPVGMGVGAALELGGGIAGMFAGPSGEAATTPKLHAYMKANRADRAKNLMSPEQKQLFGELMQQLSQGLKESAAGLNPLAIRRSAIELGVNSRARNDVIQKLKAMSADHAAKAKAAGSPLA